MESPELPNPLTPLAWLPPNVARQLEVCRYVWAATVGAWVWDLAVSLSEEFRMFTKYRLKLADVIYLLARVLSGAFVISAFCFTVAASSDCDRFAKMVGWFAALSLPANCLLFLFRIRAVFDRDRRVVAFFAVLWLAVLGGSLVAPFAVDGDHIGSTRYCITSRVNMDASSGIIISAVNDTLVFLAITFRLMTFSLADTWWTRVKAFCRGEGMGNVSKIVLQSGQLYYLVTVGVNIAAATVILIPSVPPVYRAMLSPPNVALQNAMTCRVYRHLKIGILKDGPTVSFGQPSSGVLHFAAGPSPDRPSGREGDSAYRRTEPGMVLSTVPDDFSHSAIAETEQGSKDPIEHELRRNDERKCSNDAV